jgi:hypothetical protein
MYVHKNKRKYIGYEFVSSAHCATAIVARKNSRFGKSRLALRSGEAKKKVDFLTSHTAVEEPSRHKYADSCAVYIYITFLT